MNAVTRAVGLLFAGAVSVGVYTTFVSAQAGQSLRLTAAWRASVVEGVSAQLVEAYFDRAAAQEIVILVGGRLKAGAYEALDDPAEFARLLTTHLREVNGDLHLSVRFSPEPIPERRTPSEPTAAEIAAQRDRAASANFGFTETRLLRANIGYVRFDGFHPLRWSKPAFDAVLTFLRDRSALILDLRYNTGGEADMVDAFNEQLLRRDPTLTLILTSGGTASAAEAVAYEMRHRNGATLVGARTLGAGNAGTMRRVDAHFEVFVPVVHTAWDGIGVAPHATSRRKPRSSVLNRSLRNASLIARGLNRIVRRCDTSRTPRAFGPTRSCGRFVTRRSTRRTRAPSVADISTRTPSSVYRSKQIV